MYKLHTPHTNKAPRPRWGEGLRGDSSSTTRRVTVMLRWLGFRVQPRPHCGDGAAVGAVDDAVAEGVG